MFVLNAYFCRELRFVAILCSKLRFLLRNTKVDPEFLRKKLAAEGSVPKVSECYWQLKVSLWAELRSVVQKILN